MSIRKHPTKGEGWWYIQYRPDGKKGKLVSIPFKGTEKRARVKDHLLKSRASGPVYKPLKIKLIELGGVFPSIRAMRLPKEKQGLSDSLQGTDGAVYIGPKDKILAGRLIKAGDDHGKFARGIIAWFELEFMTGWMIELETYRAGVECLSTSSTMHVDLKGLSGYELAEAKQLGLSKKVYKRSIHFSYQALRSIYFARRRHLHPDWRIFCKFIEDLPHFDELIVPGGVENGVVLYEQK